MKTYPKEKYIMSNEQKWYLIQMVCHRSIEDHYDCDIPLGLCRSEEEGKVICDQLEKENKMLDLAILHIHKANETWLNENPVPNKISYPDIPKIKKWGAGIRQQGITQEMRDEREKTKALIIKLKKEYSEAREVELALYYEYNKIYCQEVMNKYFVNHPELDEFPKLKDTIRKWNDDGRYYWKHRFSKDTSYKFEPISVLT